MDVKGKEGRKMKKNINLFITIILLISIIISGCILSDENGVGELSLTITSNIDHMTLNESVVINYTISNIGDTTVKIIGLEYYFFDELLLVKSSNGSMIWPVNVRTAPSSPPNDNHLEEIGPGEETSVSIQLTGSHYPFEVGNSYTIQGRYFIGNISTIKGSFWKGSLQSELLSISIV